MNAGYVPRTYRERTGASLKYYKVCIADSDLAIYAETDIRKPAIKILQHVRHEIELYIKKYPHFLSSLIPIPAASNAPESIIAMCRAASCAGVGPMAAVAGTVAAIVGKELAAYSSRIMIENGGDVFIQSDSMQYCAIHVPQTSPFFNRLTLRLQAAPEGMGICTSSGTLGHSYSAGKADAAVIVAQDTALADAVATAVGNCVGETHQVDHALSMAREIAGVQGAVVIAGDQIGGWGEIEFL